MGRSLVSKDGARVHVGPDYLEWSQQNHVFENLTAFDSTSCDLTGETSRFASYAERSHKPFSLSLAFSRCSGRSFIPSEDQPRDRGR